MAIDFKSISMSSFTDKTSRHLSAYLASIGLVTIALIFAFLLQYFLSIPNLVLTFLPAILVSASLFGLRASLLASLISVLCYNFFFIPPVYSFTISDPENIVALFFFSIVAIITSNLASRLHAQKLAADESAKRMEQIYNFVSLLVKSASSTELIDIAVRQVSIMLKAQAMFLLPKGPALVLCASEPPLSDLAPSDYAAAVWSWKNNQPAGPGADTLPGGQIFFMPVSASDDIIAILGVRETASEGLTALENRRLLHALLDQFAITFERFKLAEVREKIRLLAEAEKLRSALLTSISHDFRTPLASILGAATSLTEQHDSLDTLSQKDLATTIQEEAERLNRFITNLLDMTRLESGIIVPNFQTVDISDVTASALRRAKSLLASHTVRIVFPKNIPSIYADPILLEQVIFNLFDNASKYTPPESVIEITAEVEPSKLCLSISDQGSGVSDAEIENIFDKFYRANSSHNHKSGSGLGLSVCRGFIEAMGGRIKAQTGYNSGMMIKIYLPLSDINT